MLEIIVNGKTHQVEASPDTPLLYVLRNELELNGPKFGCGMAQCGACTVHIEGKQMRSCVYPVAAAAGKHITTLEGLGPAYVDAHPGTKEQLHPVQAAFIEHQAAQCGYCTNGMIMASAAILAQTPHPTEEQIRQALATNLCRCGSHFRILRAVKSASERMGA